MLARQLRKAEVKQTFARAKPVLRMTALSAFRVHYTDLEAFAKQIYGGDFNFLSAAGMTHGMMPEYRVPSPGQDTPSWTRRAAEIRDGQRIKCPILLLNVLYLDKLIPAGSYLVDTRKPVAAIDAYTALVNRLRDPLHPECVAFKAKHRRNRRFTNAARVLDQAISRDVEQHGEKR